MLKSSQVLSGEFLYTREREREREHTATTQSREGESESESDLPCFPSDWANNVAITEPRECPTRTICSLGTM